MLSRWSGVVLCRTRRLLVQMLPKKLLTVGTPFKKRDSSAAHMRDLYPNNLRMPMVARVEKYSTPFPSYIDKKSYQHVAKDGMYIHNHDFDETVELVCINF